MRFPRFAGILSLCLLPVSCATADIDSSTTSGAGGSSVTTSGAGGTGGAGGQTGQGGSIGPCVSAGDCASLTDLCNVGTCINGACEKVPANEGTPCDDGKACTQNDTCQAGVCTSGTLAFCPSSDNCHVGFCDPVTDSCTQNPGNDGAQCSDDDACTQIGSCSGGACVPGPEVDCSFLTGNCVVGLCDPGTGCYSAPANDAAPCDDGLYCTIDDACKGGLCSGVPNTCAAPGDVCMIGSCDEAQNQCTAVPGNQGASCNDKNACTTGETCGAGLCGGGAPANQGGSCDDGKACTQNDTCASGVCAGAPVVACVSGDGCCPAGCDVVADDDCGGAVYVTSSNGDPGFYGYDVTANTWAVLPSPPVTTHSQLTTDGKFVFLLGDDNEIYKFDADLAVWSSVQAGPGPFVSSPIGFFKWTPSGFYYLKDGDMQLYRSSGAAWQTHALPWSGSSAGTFDPVTNKLYIRGWFDLSLMVFNVQTNTVSAQWPNPGPVGENSRTGSYHGGFFYERDWGAPFVKVDVATGAMAMTNVNPAEGHTATDVDLEAGDIYIGPYEPTGTVFQVYNVVAGTLTTLASLPVPVNNHSTIVLVK